MDLDYEHGRQSYRVWLHVSSRNLSWRRINDEPRVRRKVETANFRLHAPHQNVFDIDHIRPANSRLRWMNT